MAFCVKQMLPFAMWYITYDIHVILWSHSMHKINWIYFYSLDFSFFPLIHRGHAKKIRIHNSFYFWCFFLLTTSQANCGINIWSKINNVWHTCNKTRCWAVKSDLNPQSKANWIYNLINSGVPGGHRMHLITRLKGIKNGKANFQEPSVNSTKELVLSFSSPSLYTFKCILVLG